MEPSEEQLRQLWKDATCSGECKMYNSKLGACVYTVHHGLPARVEPAVIGERCLHPYFHIMRNKARQKISERHETEEPAELKRAG